MSARTRESEIDIVTSTISWLARESTLEIEQLQKLEADLRARYGARKHYIAAHGLFDNLSERNSMIREAWLADVDVSVIAHRFHISIRRVRQICAGVPRQGDLMRRGNALP
jgi:hypothetical protein